MINSYDAKEESKPDYSLLSCIISQAPFGCNDLEICCIWSCTEPQLTYAKSCWMLKKILNKILTEMKFIRFDVTKPLWGGMVLFTLSSSLLFIKFERVKSWVNHEARKLMAFKLRLLWLVNRQLNYWTTEVI